MGYRPQELLCMSLLLQRVGSVCGADQFNLRGAQFPLLPLCRRRHKVTLDYCRCACIELWQMLRARSVGVHDSLQIGKTRAVVELQEGKPFRIPPRADPTLN